MSGTCSLREEGQSSSGLNRGVWVECVPPHVLLQNRVAHRKQNMSLDLAVQAFQQSANFLSPVVVTSAVVSSVTNYLLFSELLLDGSFARRNGFHVVSLI